MEYLVFTYPNCLKCEDVKAFVKEAALAAEFLDVAGKPGRMRIREFLPHVRRDEKGGIILPTILALEEGRVEAVLNTRAELEAWSRSRA